MTALEWVPRGIPENQGCRILLACYLLVPAGTIPARGALSMPNAMRRDTCIRTHLASIPDGGNVFLFFLVLLVPATFSEAATPLSDLVAKGKYIFGAAAGCGWHTEAKG